MSKVKPWSWRSVSEQIWIISFKWGTVCFCRSIGCKNIRVQSWRSIRHCKLIQIWDWCAGARLIWQIFFDLQLWPLIFLQPLDLQGCTVPHLKDMIHICSETESQGHGITFNKIYLHSNYPYFISYRGLC